MTLCGVRGMEAQYLCLMSIYRGSETQCQFRSEFPGLRFNLSSSLSRRGVITFDTNSCGWSLISVPHHGIEGLRALHLFRFESNGCGSISMPCCGLWYVLQYEFPVSGAGREYLSVGSKESINCFCGLVQPD